MFRVTIIPSASGKGGGLKKNLIFSLDFDDDGSLFATIQIIVQIFMPGLAPSLAPSPDQRAVRRLNAVSRTTW